MKRLVTAIILPFVCLAVAVTAAVYTERTLTRSIDTITAMQDEAQPDENKAEQLTQQWEKDKKILAILLKHEDVDELEMQFGKILYCAQNDEESYAETLGEAKDFITGLRSGERLSIQSIF